MSDALTRLAATLADRCRIERKLGAGGMATVYLAEDLNHQWPLQRITAADGSDLITDERL